MQRWLAGVILALSTCSSAHAVDRSQNQRPLTFERDIRPIFKTHCFHCHGEAERREGGLDVRLRRLLVTGGESGAALAPGKPAESYLLERLASGDMPPEEASQRPTEDDIAVVRQWILQGAPTLRDEPESPDDLPSITAEEIEFWAFQPIQHPQPPSADSRARINNPIDEFIQARLDPKGLTISPEAQRTTLIRRLYFDLLGLAPSPTAVEQFAADQRPNAYEILVDELLASPHYGERWGRHWLDVAGYADSEGYTDDDTERQHAWHYRDYVIDSLNGNLPYDRFILEQLAGDEMVGPPYKNLTSEQARLLTATGFLRMAADGTGAKTEDPNLAQNTVIAESIKIVTSSMLGLTIGCAQCHDHRYDPIPQSDYYSFRAIFEPAYNWKKWRTPSKRLISLYTDKDRELAAQLETEAKAVEARRTGRQKELIAATLEKQIAALPEEIQEAVREAQTTPAKERTAEQKALLKKHPSVNVSAGSLYLYDKAAANELKKMADEAAAIRSRKPEEHFVRALSEVPNQIPDSFVFFRGDHEQPKAQVTPSIFEVVQLTNGDAPIPRDDSRFATTGRRMALGNWLVGRSNPLTARVLVNRIWMHHFGTGIVRTPADFGRLGDRPSHPLLLDWLATEFINSGWNMKSLHRTMLLSATYRQTSEPTDAAQHTDPDNQLFSRAPVRRIEAEVLRDMVLQVADQLNRQPFGPPVPVMADKAGRFVIGLENLNAGRPGPVLPMNGEDLRRTVYVQVRRSRPLSLMETFDAPRMEPNCESRNSSTVSSQSLSLMNGDFITRQAGKLAESVIAAAPDSTSDRIRSVWQRVYGRTPSAEELRLASVFLDEQIELQRNGKSDVDQAQPKTDSDLTVEDKSAFETLCHMLLGSNEFLYVD